MTTKQFILLCLTCVILGLILGYLIWGHGKVITNSGTTSTVASSSAQIPTETIRYEKVYVPVPGLGGVAAASKAIIPIVPASVTSQIRDEFVSVDMQCIASGSVDATIYNNQVYNASGTTYLLQTASYTAVGYSSNKLLAGAAINTQGNTAVIVGYKLFSTPPVWGVPGIDWTANLILVR